MAVTVVTEAADTRASAGDTPAVSAAAPVRVELVVATVELGSAVLLAATERGITHRESQLDAMAAIAPTEAPAATGKGTTHREARLEDRFMVPARDRKVELLPSSLRRRQVVPVATTFRESNPALALRVNPVSSPVITGARIGMFASNAPEWLPGVQPSPTGLGRDRMQPTGSDSTVKQHRDCVTGKAERLDTPTQNVITRNTGNIAITMTMIGGVIIATLSFLLVGDFGVGMTAGGIRRGATTRIIHTMITTVQSMATMDFNPTRQ